MTAACCPCFPCKRRVEPAAPRPPPPSEDEKKRIETEKKLDNALAKAINDDDNDTGFTITEERFKDIEANVTPTILTTCQTNAFVKAFEINRKLKKMSVKGGPEEKRFKKLADEVEEFSLALTNQLLSDDIDHNKKWWDYVVDEAIRRKQKKFISHPVIDNILQRRWYGKFLEQRKSWRFRIRVLWVLIEVVLFPFLLPIFGTMELLSRSTAFNREKEEEEESNFGIYNKHLTTPFFIFARDTLSYLSLVVLHFLICLSPSTVAFSGLEWVILVFFFARLVMEGDQFIGADKAERNRHKDMFRWGVLKKRAQENGNGLLRKLINYFRDQWNKLDFIIIIIYIVTFSLRMITWSVSVSAVDNRLLAVAFDLYGLIAMLLTLRAFGHVMEGMRGTGAIQIALVYILRDVVTIFWQFVAMVLAFSFIISRIYASERSYVPATNKTEELTCNRAGLHCWWSVAQHLVWSVLGIADWDTLSSEDSASESLVHLLYGLFLIMGVILLVNMMIALLSNTYQRVQENSLIEWSFKKALTVQTYSFYHPVPVPFNLVSIPAVALYKFCKRKRGSEIESSSFDKYSSSRVKSDMRWITGWYRTTFGDSFPLTGDGKIDRILHQASGNREMVNEIARQVFRKRGSTEVKFRTGERTWKSSGIEIEGIMLTYQGPDFCEECKMQSAVQTEPCTEPRTKPRTEPRHGARYLTPFTREMPRMEVLIQEIVKSREVGVGAVFKDYNHHFMPGWRDGSVGYHSYGRIHENSHTVWGREAKDSLAYRGDLMACEVDFDNASEENRTIPVKFFLNCREVGQATMRYKSDREDVRPFPFIGLCGKGTRVLVRMCSKRDPFNELPATKEHSHTDMLEKKMDSMEKRIMEQSEERKTEMGCVEKQMNSMEKRITEQLEERKEQVGSVVKQMNSMEKRITEQLEERKREVEIMEENMRKKMKNMEEDRRKETENRRKEMKDRRKEMKDRRKEMTELRELVLQLLDLKKNP